MMKNIQEYRDLIAQANRLYTEPKLSQEQADIIKTMADALTRLIVACDMIDQQNEINILHAHRESPNDVLGPAGAILGSHIRDHLKHVGLSSHEHLNEYWNTKYDFTISNEEREQRLEELKDKK